MKFNCGPTLAERWRLRRERQIKEIRDDLDRYANWQDFFTVLPRRVAPGDCRWLETIQIRDTRAKTSKFTNKERASRIVWEGYHAEYVRPVWEYRAKENK